MRKTYAHNSIIIGFLVGLLVALQTESIVLGALSCIAVSVVGFILIRLLENAVDKGVDAVADKTEQAIRSRKAKNGACAPAQNTTRFPGNHR